MNIFMDPTFLRLVSQVQGELKDAMTMNDPSLGGTKLKMQEIIDKVGAHIDREKETKNVQKS